MVEDDLAVELFEVGHQPNNLPASTNPSISTSMSSSDENSDSEARAVAVHAELAHQRLGAVVARPHAHAELVEHLGQVVRVHVAVGDGEDAAAVPRPPAARTR